MKRVAIVDYKLCNLDSISRAVEACGGSVLRTSSASDLDAADMLIVPGVGHFGAAMENLHRFGLVESIRKQAGDGKPLLGICLGMQLLAEASEEARGVEGLGLIAGDVSRLRGDAGSRVPHMGWNVVETESVDPLLQGVPAGSDFYFVHSYHFAPRERDHVVASTPYCGRFAAIVRKGNVMGTQFHPEKSQTVGFALLRNFIFEVATRTT